MKGNSKKFIFLKLFISYFAIMLIPLVTCTLMYAESVKIGTEYAKKQNTLMLGQVKNTLDIRLDEIQSTSHQIVTDKKVISVLNTSDYREGSADFYRIWDLCNNMPNYKLTNKLILENYIFLKESNIAINSNSAFPDMDNFYGRAFSYGKMSCSEWNDFLWKTFYVQKYLPTSEVVINGAKKSAICYMQSLPFDSASSAQGVSVILIDEKAIQSMLQCFDIGSSGMVFIEDSKGNLISCVTGAKCSLKPSDINSDIHKAKSPQDIVITSIKSDFNQWNYVSVIPEEIILSKVRYIKNLALILLMLSLILGGAASFFLTYRKANILAAVTEKFASLFGKNSGSGKSSDVFSYIDSSVTELIDSNINLEKSMKEQAPLLEAARLRMLLCGELTDESIAGLFGETALMNLLVADICIDFDSDNEISGIESFLEYNKANIVVKNKINQSLGKHHYMLDINRKTIALLVFFDDKDMKSAKVCISDTLQSICGDLENSYHINVFFALSEIHHGMNTANVAFEQANNVTDYMRYYKSQKVLWYSEIPKESGFYYYPVDIELRLTGMVKSGDTENVKKILHTIYSENFEKRQLSSEMLQQLMYSMKGTIIRGLGSMSYDQTVQEVIRDLYKASTIDEIFNCVIRANIRVSLAMKERRTSNQNNLKEQVLNFMENHYQQSELTLEQLAGSLGYTDSNMYSFFKNSIGSTFADYLENLRINKACEFLLNSDATVKDVSVKVGYNSDNSFRRAFKRIMGVSPSEYVQAAHTN